MRVKIKPIVNVVGEEELIIIPITKSRDYYLCLNFFEDIPEGRLARLVVVLDKYDEINNNIVKIAGKKTFVEAEEVEEAYTELSKVIVIERKAPSYVIPLYFNIEVTEVSLTESEGVKGYFNYIKKYGEIKIERLRNIIPFSVNELV
ncbi:MAG: hypothetical protein QXV69_07090 [Sulfolobaceae archaeon]